MATKPAITKIIFMTGAPDASSLQWEPEHLTSSLLPCFTDSLMLALRVDSPVTPSWRSLSLKPNHMSTGRTPRGHVEHRSETTKGVEEASFLSTSTLSYVSEVSDGTAKSSNTHSVLSNFFEHSLAVHKDLASSQVVNFESSASTSFSVGSWELSSTFDYTSPVPQRPIPRASHLTALRDVPSSAYLHSIAPQTMTVDLIVGIISIPEPRSIKTRRGDQMELLEILVGDETMSGFGLNLWLPTARSGSNELREATTRLRPQDIILARNVALSTFRGNVYGQSLQKDWTKLDLLYRNAIDRYDEFGAYNLQDVRDEEVDDDQLHKVRRVRDWVLMFVGPQTEHKDQFVDHQDSREAKKRRLLPLDTQ